MVEICESAGSDQTERASRPGAAWEGPALGLPLHTQADRHTARGHQGGHWAE